MGTHASPPRPYSFAAKSGPGANNCVGTRPRDPPMTTTSAQDPQPGELPLQQLDRVVIRFAGDSGDGMQVTGNQFTRTSALFGNDLATLPDFPAEIRAPAAADHREPDHEDRGPESQRALDPVAHHERLVGRSVREDVEGPEAEPVVRAHLEGPHRPDQESAEDSEVRRRLTPAPQVEGRRHARAQREQALLPEAAEDGERRGRGDGPRRGRRRARHRARRVSPYQHRDRTYRGRTRRPRASPPGETGARAAVGTVRTSSIR